MFTGIIEETGIIEKISSSKMTVRAPKVAASCALGQSIAINGVCLTVSELKAPHISFDVMEQTVRSSTLGKLRSGDNVNMEQAARPDSFLGGHIVQGHVDGVGKVSSMIKQPHSTLITITVDAYLTENMIEKGSVALDGVSLTLSEVKRDMFTVSLIPTTLKETILGTKKVGDSVNIETDIIGKYVKKYVAGAKGVTEDLLKRTGFME